MDYLDTVSLEYVKDMYHLERHYDCVFVGFDEYLKEHFIPTYDSELNFIGYSRSSDHAL